MKDYGKYHLGSASVLKGAYNNSLITVHVYITAADMYVYGTLSLTPFRVGLLVTILIIEFLGRKKTMAIEFVACMAGFLLLYICAVL